MYVEVSIRKKKDLYAQTDSHAYMLRVTQHENGLYSGESLINIPKRAGIYAVKYDK